MITKQNSEFWYNVTVQFSNLHYLLVFELQSCSAWITEHLNCTINQIFKPGILDALLEPLVNFELEPFINLVILLALPLRTVGIFTLALLVCL